MQGLTPEFGPPEFGLRYCSHVRKRKRQRTMAIATAMLAVAVVMGPASTSASGQGRLSAATKLRCTFTQGAVGTWANDGPTARAAVRPTTLVLRLEGIDVDSGSAQVRTGSMTSEITVKQTGGYLHFMQTFKGGALYTTTVFETPAGAFKAVHSRHEYFTVPVPGATSSPEQYYGDCQAE